MTVTTTSSQAAAPVETVTVTIDGVALDVPKGTLIIRAAEQLGIAIPRFCDHPLLDPVAACRMCLIEIEGQPKPQPACAIACADGMVVKTQRTSDVADVAQHAVMEFLLINHPLDCPICDKGGECPLQNQAMTNGRGETRFEGAKRLFPKPINISAQVLLDRERCVSCARCTRFSEQIAGDPFIELIERGAKQQVGIAQDVPFDSYFSGNTIQICPVGALTSAMYRFRSRPFDLVSTPTACEHCASGCSLRTDVRRGSITRRLAAPDAEVNEDWSCDKGRFAFQYVSSADRLTHPLVRGEDGELWGASWPEALAAAAAGLAAASGRAGVITGGRLTYEDAYAYAKFARVVLGTNHVDFRSRVASDEEQAFLAAHVAGRPLATTYADVEAAPVVLLVDLEPEDESPILFLRLRKAVRNHGQQVLSLGPVVTRGTEKLSGTWLPAAPGEAPGVLASLADGSHEASEAVRSPGAVVLVGERAAATPGTLTAVGRLAAATGCSLAWVPRRAGDRGAVEAGLLPRLLPGGRPVDEAAARVDAATAWGISELPSEPGLDRAGMLAAAARGDLGALVVAGVDVDDWPEGGAAARAALDAVPFLVALDTHANAVTERADVVLPVAAAPERAGTFLDWEGRRRPFRTALRDRGLMTDARVLAQLADEADVALGTATVDAARREIAELGAWSGPYAAAPEGGESTEGSDAGDGLLLAGWRALLDEGVLQQGEPYLAATARPLVARLSAATADALGVDEGGLVVIEGRGGTVTRPVSLAPVSDGVVVLTEALERVLGQGAGSRVVVRPGGAA